MKFLWNYFNSISQRSSFIGAGNLDLRKKLEFIRIGLAAQGSDQRETLRKIHSLHDMRNAIVHSSFCEDDDGILFEYVDKFGELRLPNRPKSSSDLFPDTLIKYSEFDRCDAEGYRINKILDQLLSSLTPVTEVDDDLASRIEEAIKSSNNVIRFPLDPPLNEP
jgi:hypothetical protein